MKYLLDTCVLSEFAKPQPNARVVEWLASQRETNLFLSTLTLGELQKGVGKLPHSKRRAALEEWLHRDMRTRFKDRILAVNDEVSLIWGTLQGEAERRGQPLPVIDALIAATAIANQLIVVTRNDQDMLRTGARLVDPWRDE